jgi:hypothetical protein
MARIRTIKPEFFTSEDIVARSPMARLLYIALWCEADKEGRLVWKPATFKLRYLPGDDCDVHALCAELVDAGLVVLYGEGFAHIPTFNAHQHINPRESVSQLPEPTRQARVGTRQARVGDAQGGREGKGRERKEEKPSPSAPERFDAFWATYPRKVGKDAARKAFDKRNPDGPLLTLMLKAIHSQAKSDPWCKDGGQFIPHPSTWLNEGRWLDEGVVMPEEAPRKYFVPEPPQTPEQREAANKARLLAMSIVKPIRSTA